VVISQDPAQTGESVLAELASWLVLPQLPQGGGEVGGRAQGAGMVVAQDPAAAGEGALGELAGWLILPQLPQIEGEVVDRVQRVGVILAQRGTAQAPGTFEQRPGRAGFPPAVPIRGRAVKQPGHIPLGPGEAAVGISGDQDVGQELAPGRPGRRVVPRVGRDRGTQQPHRQRGQVGLLVGLRAQARGEQPVQRPGGRPAARSPLPA